MSAGEGAEALHRVDFAIEGRPILLGPGSAEHLRRLDALALVLRREPGTNPDFARLSPATRARVRLSLNVLLASWCDRQGLCKILQEESW